MKDLTQGSIVSHISVMAPQIFAGMIMMMLCGLIDLYFVAGLGDAAIAGVGAAGNVGFLINALTQILERRQRIADFAGGRTQGPGRCQPGVQSIAGPVGGIFLSDAGRGMPAGAQLHARDCRRRCRDRGGHHLSALVHAGAGAAIRRAGDGLRAARHRHRAPDRDRADLDGDPQHAAGAGPDFGLGHQLAARRCRGGPGEHDRGRGRGGDDVGLFPPLRALCRDRPSIVASADRRNGSAY